MAAETVSKSWKVLDPLEGVFWINKIVCLELLPAISTDQILELFSLVRISVFFLQN